MKRLLLLLLCLLMVLGMTACGKDDGGNDRNTAPTDEEDIFIASYAHDPLIDRFFVEFLEKFPSGTLDPLTIRRGKDTSEYIAVINTCRVTLRNVSTEVAVGPNTTTMYLLRATIEGGTSVESRDLMMEAFSKITRTLDPKCTTDMVNATVSHLTAQSNTVANYNASSNVKIEAYIPIVEKHGVACRIDLVAYNYAPLEK